MSKKIGELKTYRVRWDDMSWEFTTTSPGKARYMAYIDSCDCFEITFKKFIELTRVNSTGGIITSEAFKKNAEYRGIPFAYCGMVVKVGDDMGNIVGHNDSANLDVLFSSGKYKGIVLNCHPHSEMEYFDAKGELIKSFKKQAA